MLTAIRMAILIVGVGLALALSSGAKAQETTTIAVGDNWFCDSSFQDGVCEKTINAGDTVVWDLSGATAGHTSTECGTSCESPTTSPVWDSGLIDAGSSFQFTFDQAGTFLYYCEVHPFEMRGQIVVQGSGQVQPTDTPPPGDGEAAPTSTQEVVAVPETGADTTGGSGALWLVTLLGAAGAALIGMGVLAYRRVQA